MAFPSPQPGQVIRYSYLWHDDYLRGQEEGVKDRPCAVVVATPNEAGDTVVMVLPITHTPPATPALAIEIPAAVKRRLGMDDERSWVLVTEANRFIWPGPDLRPAKPGDPASVLYGPLPHRLFEQIRLAFAAAIRARQARAIPRSE